MKPGSLGVSRRMAFASGFMLLAPDYRQEPRRSEVIDFLQRLGFEIYDVGKEAVVVFYVEAPTIEDVEELIKTAEQHQGVAKAYITYGFMGSDEERWEINRALESGELELDETTIEYIKSILARLEPGRG